MRMGLIRSTAGLSVAAVVGVSLVVVVAGEGAAVAAATLTSVGAIRRGFLAGVPSVPAKVQELGCLFGYRHLMVGYTRGRLCVKVDVKAIVHEL